MSEWREVDARRSRAERSIGGHGYRAQHAESVDDGVPFVTSANVDDGRSARADESVRSHEDDCDGRRRSVASRGDVVVA